jgi:tetratricopeptide (TPR) repeat protein
MTQPAKRRPRLKGVDVKPGSVRTARLDAGLSLAAVASGELTRAAIHLIETGRSRPSMPTLQLIASRTGKPLSYFLADRPLATSRRERDPRLAELERLVEFNQHQEAIALGRSLREQQLEPADEALVNHLLGEALVRTTQPDAALEPLRRAKELYGLLGDRYGYVDVLDWEASCLYHLEDAQALPMLEEALRLCRELQPQAAQLEVRIRGHLGNLYILRKEWAKAIRCFELAVETAGSLHDFGRTALMYNDLSIAYQETGNLAKAASAAQRALAISSMQRDLQNVARIENNLGLVLMKQGDYDGAKTHLESSLDVCKQVGLERGRAHVLLSLGELHSNRGELALAEGYFEDAAVLAQSLGEKLTLALAHEFLGRLAAERGDHEESDINFWRAIELLSREQAPERLVECHAAYAQVLEDRGDTRTANQHWKEALAASRPGLVRPVSLDSDLIARAN